MTGSLYIHLMIRSTVLAVSGNVFSYYLYFLSYYLNKKYFSFVYVMLNKD